MRMWIRNLVELSCSRMRHLAAMSMCCATLLIGGCASVSSPAGKIEDGASKEKAAGVLVKPKRAARINTRSEYDLIIKESVRIN